MRNALLVRSVDALLTLGGSWGTLSEIALAARTGVRAGVRGRGWDSPGPEVETFDEVDDAVSALLARVFHIR